MAHDQAVQSLAVESYLLGEMPSPEREAFEEHYFECAICAEDVRSALQFIEDAKEVWAEDERLAAPRRTPAALPSTTRWTWLAWLQPQFAAAAIVVLLIAAGAGTFSALSARRQIGDAAAPRIVRSTTLRPQTRGEATVLTTAPGEAVMLQFDLPESAASEFQFVVRSEDSAAVLRLSGRAPESGLPVTLSIPRFELSPGRYTLVVETVEPPGGGGIEVARYPFEVRRP
jgi:hypothetical protein